MILATCERHVAAPIAVVWDLVSTAAGLTRWMAVDAELELGVGGRIRWVHDNGWVVCGEIVEVAVQHRLAFTYGWESGGFPVPVGSSEVSITLTPTEGGTQVSIRHSGLTAAMAAQHTDGWSLFADRLMIAAAHAPGAAR